MRLLPVYPAFLLCLLIGALSPAFATNYYLSNAGNNTFSGTRPDSAWKTINRLNAAILQPGDSILLRKGDTFPGEINLKSSGIAGQPIYFGSYGNNGANPVIAGDTTVVGWGSSTGHSYVATSAKTVYNVFVNGVMMTSARYPNSGFLTIQSSDGNNDLLDKAMNQTINWAGAQVNVRSSDTKYENTTVLSSDTGLITFSTPLSNTLSAGYGYYFDHTLAALDKENEWYYDATNQQLYLWTPFSVNPNTLTVTGSVFNYGIKGSNNSYITVQGIDFKNQAKDGVFIDSTCSNIHLLNCNFSGCSLRGVNLTTAVSDSINNCSFNNITGDGISLTNATQSVISNNHIHNIGIIPGYGLDGITAYDAIRFAGTGNTVSNNLIDTVGASAIIFTGKNNLIDKNLMHNAVVTLNSESAITSDNDSLQTIISNNFIYNTRGNNEATPANILFTSGISLNNSSNITISNNTIVNTITNGIYVQSNNHNNTIQDNVVYNSESAQIYFQDQDTTVSVTSTNTINNNVFYCLNSTQQSMILKGFNKKFHPGTFDKNYYCNPYSYFPISLNIIDTAISLYPFNLKSWRTFYGNDINSHQSLVSFRTFNVLDSIGPNLITNGNLDMNTDDWSSFPLDNNLFLLGDTTALNNGCLKLEFIQGSKFPYFEFASVDTSVKGGSYYQFKMSLLGTGENYLEAYCKRENLYFFSSLGFDKYFPISKQRTDYSAVFQANENYSPAQLGFKMFNIDSVIWMDNISLHEVSVTYNDSSKQSKLFANYSQASVAFSLGDSVFEDLDGNVVSGSVTVNAYSSKVLVYDSLLSVNVLAIKEPTQGITVFPVPLDPSADLLNIKMTSGIKDEASISLVDIYGKTQLIQTSDLKNQVLFSLKIPNNISSGLYFVKVQNGKEVYQSKIIIQKN